MIRYLTWCWRSSLEIFGKLLFGFSPFCALDMNLLNLFIKKKIANELPIETQCKFNACYQMPKTSFLGMDIWYFVPFFIWGCDMSLQTFYPFIDIMIKNA